MKYKGPVDCFKVIAREEGAAGFYRGITANLIGVTPEKAIKLAVNDNLREYWTKPDGSVPLHKAVISGGSIIYSFLFHFSNSCWILPMYCYKPNGNHQNPYASASNIANRTKNRISPSLQRIGN